MLARQVRTQRRSNRAPVCRPAPLRLVRRRLRPLGPAAAPRLGAAVSGLPRGSTAIDRAGKSEAVRHWRSERSGARATRAASAEAGPGRILADRYWLGRPLGTGATASVFEALDTRDDRRVAIKLLRPELESDATLRAQFLSQAAIASRVPHAGIARVLGVSDGEGGPVFLVMDRLWGETLEERCCRLNAGEVAAILYELLDVLAAAHDEGVVHCDIKPSNVFLTNDGVVKLLDFGDARLTDAQDTAARPTPVGTPGFMPPEQILGPYTEIDVRSDVWSVGALGFTLLSGRPPHHGQTPLETMLLGASSEVPALGPLVPAVPGALARVIDRALCKEKCKRWPSARDMQLALAQAYRQTFGADLALSRSRSGGFPAGIRPPVAKTPREYFVPTLVSRVDAAPPSSKTRGPTPRSEQVAATPGIPVVQGGRGLQGAAGAALAVLGTAVVSLSTCAPALVSLGGLGMAFGGCLLARAISAVHAALSEQAIAVFMRARSPRA
jgi:eukaryotic-like serine/threonine-protein kinase